jgi:peptide deformylase
MAQSMHCPVCSHSQRHKVSLMIRDLVLYPDKRLETPCPPVEEFDNADLQQLVADLFESMYFHGGAGLAAPQIGILKQAAVIDYSAGKDPDQKIVLINPIITDMQGTQCGEEGCLSFPGFTETVVRSMSVIIEAKDLAGKAVHLSSDGLLARALQHEIDHLNGIVFIRRMSSLKRELIRRKIRGLLHAGKWGSSQKLA